MYSIHGFVFKSNEDNEVIRVQISSGSHKVANYEEAHQMFQNGGYSHYMFILRKEEE